MQDNSDLLKKLALRNAVIKKHRSAINMVADCYAGEGVITSMLWQHVAKQVICIDRNRRKLNKIQVPQIKTLCGNNMDFIDDIAHCDLFDCDAYGLVMPFIQTLADRVSQKWVVFTDGTPEKGRKVYSAFKQFDAQCQQLFSEWHVEMSAGGNAYYGYGLLK